MCAGASLQVSKILVRGHERRDHMLEWNAGQQGVGRGNGLGDVRGFTKKLVLDYRDLMFARDGLLLDQSDDRGPRGARLELAP